ALDPNNGDVLALVSLPGFDPTLFGRGITAGEYGTLQSDIDRPLFNRALRGTYPPGSTIKPGLALAALTYHTVDPQARKYCTGRFTCRAARTCSASTTTRSMATWTSTMPSRTPAMCTST